MFRTLMSIGLMLPLLAWTADGTPATGPKVLSPEQIEQCRQDRREVVALNQDLTAQKALIDQRGDALLATESQLKQSRDWLDTQRSALQKQEDELKRRSNDMAAYFNQATVVKPSADAYKEHVDRYNSEVRAHKALLDQYNADVAVLNAQLDQLDAKARATDSRCAGPVIRRGSPGTPAPAADETPRTTLSPATRVIP